MSLITPTAGPRVIHRDGMRGGAPGRVPDARPLPLVPPATPVDARRSKRVRSPLVSSADGQLIVPARADGFIDFHPADELLTWTRDVPLEWERELRQHSPKSDEHGWLHLVWEPGERWVPGQRWTLYEMLHEKFVDDEILEELYGESPRSEGHYCSTKVPDQFQCLCRRKREAWRDGPCTLIDRTQWMLWRQTGYFGRPFWIIQGDRGGHKFKFNGQEKEIRRLAGQAGDPPPMGDLAYAPFDQRVVAHITRNNRLSQLGQTLGEFKRTMGEGYEQHKATLARGLREEYVKWFDEQMLDVNELFVSAARKGQMDGERRTAVDFERVEEIALGQFIETGILPSAAEIHRTHKKLY
jgi:hypothetical protein